MFARILRCGAVAVAGGFLLLLWAAGLGAQAAEIKVMATVAFTPTLTELGPKFEAATGNKLVIVYSVIADLKKRIEAGETADVMILSRTALDDLQTQGKVASASIVNLGKSYVAVGVRAGAPKPDISTPDKLMAALLATKSISYAHLSPEHLRSAVARLDTALPAIVSAQASAQEVVSEGVLLRK